MAKLNLLPWREERRQVRKREFFTTMGLITAGAIAIAFGAYMFMSSQLELQDSRNARLTSEIARLDKIIEDIKGLDEQKASLLKRKEIIESLQGSRSLMVHLFDVMRTAIPNGVKLTNIKQTGNSITLEGVSESPARVSQYMRSLDDSDYLKDADIKLVTSTAATDAPAVRTTGAVPASAQNTFTITVSTQEPTVDTGPVSEQPGVPASNAEAAAQVFENATALPPATEGPKQ